jgi:PAT family acetyl-CoA transporter-like MFS transporter 1
MHFWGWVFLGVTLAIWIGKVEKEVEKGHEPDGVVETYQHIISIFRLPSVRTLAFILLTCRLSFAPADSAWTFKLMEYGMPKADLATISPLLLVIGLALPALLSQHVSSNPLRIFSIGYAMKLITTLLGYIMLQHCKHVFALSEDPPLSFYAFLTTLMVVNEVAGQLMSVSSMFFSAKVSDPSIGGTYMTLLNTLSNLGSKWPNALSLWLLPKMTMSSCLSKSNEVLAFDCVHSSQCMHNGGHCIIHSDGYTPQICLAIVYGIFWLALCGGLLARLGALSPNEWLIKNRNI